MPSLRTFTTLLCLSLLASACGPGDDGTGGATEPSTETASATESVESTGSAGATEGATTSGGTTTLEPTGSTGDDTSTGGTTIDPGTETDTDEPVITTGEPMAGPCDDLVAPDPANTFFDFAELVHVLEEPDHYFTISGSDGGNSWDVTFFGLGAEDPAPGVWPMHMVIGEEWVGEAGSGVNGTATLELITVTPECVTGRISELVVDNEVLFVDKELPGGFVATRRTF